MRIKLNLLHLTPRKNPAVYWLYVDITNILQIKHLKHRIQKVIKETRDIDVCLDNIPFLDEDDIHAINENEEVTVMLKEINMYTESNNFKNDSRKSEVCNFSSFNNTLSAQHLDLIPVNCNESTPILTDSLNCKSINGNESVVSSILPKSTKKRVRKRTHKKSKVQLEPVENNIVDIDASTSSVPSIEPNKMHKRFKLDHEENYQQEESSSSDTSIEEVLHVTREVFRCGSSSSNFEKKQKTIQPVWKQENVSSKPFKTKVGQVPVFVRPPKCTSTKSTQNSFHLEDENFKANECSVNENYDMLVVDWKNMSTIKISNISELKLHDLLQFKTLCMSDNGEPQMSSVITARLENIDGDTLEIQVLSGIREFMTVNSKFRMDNDDEDVETLRTANYYDLYDITKLV